MLQPYLVQIQLQNRGEVISERRVRMPEDEARRVYDTLELLLPSSTANDDAPRKNWTELLWPVVNRRRGELIDKSILRNLTDDEQAELAMLQEYADVYLERFDLPRLEAVKKLVAAAEAPKPGRYAEAAERARMPDGSLSVSRYISECNYIDAAKQPPTPVNQFYYNEKQAIREGWILADVDSSGYLEIQRHDESEIFDDDNAAIAYVTEMAYRGDHHAREVFARIAASRKLVPNRPGSTGGQQ